MPVGGAALIYSVTAFYLYAKTYPRHTRTFRRTLVAIVWLEIPVLVFLIVVYVGLVEPPSFVWPYVLVSVFLAPIMVDGMRRFLGPFRR
jgi:hypothetical protein